jgi:hypothetical protein
MPAAPEATGVVLPWDILLGPALAQRHLDPYLVWSVQTEFRQHKPLAKPLKYVDFLVELAAPVARSPRWPSMVEMPEVYRQPLPGAGAARACHVTLRMAFGATASHRTVMRRIVALALLPRIRRLQFGFPRPARSWEPLPVPREPPPAPRPATKVVIGVLDDACPFGHESLLDARGRSRVVALWDQSLSRDRSPALFGYGRERFGGHFAALRARHADEEALYADPEALQSRLKWRSSHAAAVVTLAAGAPARLPVRPTGRHLARAAEDSITLGRAPADEASAAPVVMVQFPHEQVDLAGSRWMVVRALDGLRYLADMAERLNPAPRDGPLPLVANLSYGSGVGAHDGTGVLETAMDELAAAHGRMAIVLAAGNSHGTTRQGDKDALAYAPSGRHASRPLPGGATIRLELCVPPNKALETYLELWFSVATKAHDAKQWLANGEVAVTATSPAGQRLHIEIPGIAFDDGNSRLTGAGLIGFPRVVHSRLRSMALLVVAATQMSATRIEVPSGIWRIDVRNLGTRALRLDAWVERDLLPGAARRSQAARLLDPGDGGGGLTDDDTFNNIATGTQPFRAGALVWRHTLPATEISPYSSAARNDTVGPEFSAVADESPSLPGIRVAGSTSGAIVRMNGTSVAAPQVARYLANRLARGETLAKVRADLSKATGGTRRRGRIRV